VTLSPDRVPAPGDGSGALANLCGPGSRTILMVWSVPDDVLVAAVAVGDADATTAFVRRYQARVFGLARAILGDARLAEDVAQEAFVRAWRHAPAYDPRRGSVPAWLLTITRNLALDAIRLRRPEPIDPEIILRLDREAGGDAPRPETAAEISDELARVRAALATLPPEQGRALVLATVCGRTAQEISEHEGIPLGTAKTRIRTGLHRVRDVLARREGASAG
jgi:RNA polymerase sigma factor (sigma-70 family)